MGKRRLSAEAFTATFRSVADEGGSATHRGEQRHKEGLGLHPLVDPKGYGGIRRSIGWLEPKGGKFVLKNGPAILLETRFDTTGSMGGNVQLAFDALPRSYKLLKEVQRAPLGRYDLHIMTSIFGDQCDNYILQRTQAEMDEQAAEQLRLMVPEGNGGDSDEDPDYGLFAGAYLTCADIVKQGLKSYDFTVTDARGRGVIDKGNLVRVFGDEVFDRVRANGYQIKEDKLPRTEAIVIDLKKIAHAFLIQVEDHSEVTRFWKGLYGGGRVILIPDTSLLPEVEAAVIGLTEGTLDLQSLESFLQKDAAMSKSDATMIRKAVAHIPIGAQALLPNFKKIPKAGDIFAKKGDIWPIGSDQAEGGVEDAPEEGEKPKPKKDKPGMWH